MAAAETTPAPADRLATPAVVLWPEHDPLVAREWSDRIDAFFSQARSASWTGPVTTRRLNIRP